MPSTAYKTAAGWIASNRHTATADEDILLSNVGGDTIHFEITTDDAVPALDVSKGHPVQPGRSQAMQIKSGERLWIAGNDVPVTLLVG
ncbi:MULTISPECIES: hypothetical protein [unclassified Ruegeria]|uniref:hypothetical protein n=1 Tax=unclassified Ruegeria TaxID=2625375 RepID=UPI001487B0A8|nr:MULTISPECIES: hypothetical protein [unclassified Ruegeria]